MPMARRLRRRHLEPGLQKRTCTCVSIAMHMLQRMQSDRSGRARAFLQPTSAELT